MSATIPANSGLARTKYANDVMEGHLRQNPFSPIMRPFGDNSIILTKKLVEGEGTTVQVNFTDEMSMDSWRTGDQRVSGTGEQLRLVKDDITIRRDRAAIQVNDITESALRTGIDLPETAKRRLSRAAASRIAYGLLTALCDPTSGRTQNRYLYGGADSNWNATHATAMANINATDGKFTLATIDAAKFKAQNETSGRAFMSPATITQKDGTTQEKWVALLNPFDAKNLKQSVDYKTLVVNKDKPVFNVVNGGFYIGEYNDTLIYEMPSFYKPTALNPNPMINVAAGAGGIDVVQSLFLGANAACLAYGNVKIFENGVMPAMKTTVDTDGAVRMVITTEIGDHGGDSEMAVTMVPGYRKLVDSSSGTAEDYGVIHMYSAK